MKRVVLFLAAGLLAAAFSGPALAQCKLGNNITHVVYIEFDNVHFTRDNPNVPSDLEQMPNLLNFLKNKGTLDTGDHAVLISHTANDILTTQTGLYSADTSIFVSNSFGLFSPGGGNAVFPSSFFYWTDKVEDIQPPFDTDATYALTTPTGQNVPYPRAPFARAGCTVAPFLTGQPVP